MATINELDIKQLLSKFLSTKTTGQNSNIEIQNIINTIATAFLLHPQIALSFVNKSKNVLVVDIAREIKLLNDILGRLDYLNNNELPIASTSGLVEAQTVLLELDKLGAIDKELLARYKNIIEKFAQKNLVSVKSGSSTDMRLNSVEAKEDIYVGLASFLVLHNLIKIRIQDLLNSVDNFNTSGVVNFVSRNLITNLRTSLSDLKQQIDSDSISKIATLIELFSGKAALASLVNPYGLMDPTVLTGLLPVGSKVTAYSTPTKARAISAVGPWFTQQPNFTVSINGGPNINIPFPTSGVNHNVFLISSKTAATYNIPVNSKLYIRVNTFGLPPPDSSLYPNRNGHIIPVSITSGPAVSIATIKNDIEAGLRVKDGLGVFNQYGLTATFGPTTNNQLLLFGPTGVTKLEVLGVVDGTWLVPPKAMANVPPSCHEELGFSFNQSTGPLDILDPYMLSNCINLHQLNINTLVVDSKLVVETISNDENSKLRFSTGIANDIGFQVNEDIPPAPDFVYLKNKGEPINLEVLDVYPNYTISVGPKTASIKEVLNDSVILDTIAPVGVDMNVSIISDLTIMTQQLILKLLAYSSTFENDTIQLDQALSPIITSTVTNVQISDARRLIKEIITKLTALKNDLATIPTINSKSSSEVLAKEVLNTLQSRNLDKLIDLLNNCRFKEFFQTTPDNASSGTSLMKNIEEVGRNDVISRATPIASTTPTEIE